MTYDRCLVSLKRGEKAILRYTAGCINRVTIELVFEGGVAGSVIWRDVNNAPRVEEAPSVIVNLMDAKLQSFDELLDYLRNAPEDRGCTTASPEMVVEWFEGEKLISTEKFPNAELDERGTVTLVSFLHRCQIAMKDKR